jgi:hypothetical protein
MTREDWVEVVSWINPRFAGREWTGQQIRAYYDDLKQFDAADVWAAVHQLYAKGLDFPPSGSKLRSAAIEIRRHRNPPAQALPRGDTMTLAEYTESHYGTIMSMAEVVALEHGALAPQFCAEWRRACRMGDHSRCEQHPVEEET